MVSVYGLRVKKAISDLWLLLVGMVMLEVRRRSGSERGNEATVVIVVIIRVVRCCWRLRIRIPLRVRRWRDVNVVHASTRGRIWKQGGGLEGEGW